MEKFEALLKLLSMFDTTFTHISPTEIVIECPCDIVNDYAKVDLPQLAIIQDATTGGGWDEIRIHIEYDTKHDSLNWLVVDVNEEIGG